MDLYLEGQYSQARQALLDFVSTHPSDENLQHARYQSILTLFNLEDYAGFQQEASQYIAQYPEDSFVPYLIYYQAMADRKQGDLAKAEERLESIRRLYPEFSNHRQEMIVTH
jgi:TolA-binding protein